MTALQAERRSVRCPRCGAGVGVSCHGTRGSMKAVVPEHDQRRREVARLKVEGARECACADCHWAAVKAADVASNGLTISRDAAGLLRVSS